MPFARAEIKPDFSRFAAGGRIVAGQNHILVDSVSKFRIYDSVPP
jgi:hypothetical protein